MTRAPRVAFVLCAACTDHATGSAALSYERILFAGIHAEDTDATITWYTDVLGLQPQGDVWFGLADKSSVEIFSGGEASPETKLSAQQSFTAGFSVPDLEAQTEVLVDRGVTFLGSAGGSVDDSRATLRDLEGNVLVLVEVAASTTVPSSSAYTSIAWGGLTVEDLAGTAAWYRDTFGLDGTVGTDRAVFDLALGTIELTAGGLAQDGAKNAKEQSTVLGLEVPDLDAAISELERRGAELSGDIARWESDTWPDERWISVVDPEGNEILVKEVTD